MKKNLFVLLLALSLLFAVSCKSSTSSKISSSTEWNKGFEKFLNAKQAEANSTSFFASKVAGTEELKADSAVKLLMDVSMKMSVNLTEEEKALLSQEQLNLLNVNYNYKDIESILTPNWSIQYTKDYKKAAMEGNSFVPGIHLEKMASDNTYKYAITSADDNYDWSEWHGVDPLEKSLYDEWKNLVSVISSEEGFNKAKFEDGVYKLVIYSSYSGNGDKYTIEKPETDSIEINVEVAFNEDKDIWTIDFSMKGKDIIDTTLVDVDCTMNIDVEYINDYTFDKQVPSLDN